LIEINLAAGADRRRSAARRGPSLSLPRLPSIAGADSRTVLLGAGATLLLFVVGFAIWRAGQQRAELEAAIQAEVTDSTRFATTIQLVHALRARQDTIRQKIGVIREVDQRRYVWPHLMDEISSSVPAFTWLTQISSAEAADTLNPGLVMTVQGNAGSTQALTRFMKNLELSSYIRDVTLVTSEQADVEGRAIHRFTLEAKYETPDSSAIETVPIIAVD
jgi:Tfp pilus assembly protein PilN